MTEKIGGKKKISGVKSAREAEQVESTEQISGVRDVGRVERMGGVGRTDATSKRRKTRTMTLEEREEIFRMIGEEAEKMFGASKMPAEKRKVVEQAVKMAVDSGLIEESEDEVKK